MDKVKTYFAETRPQFLLLSIILVFLGVVTAMSITGTLSLLNASLALVGLVLLHISVNVLNDYFDYISGIDLHSNRTPFNGGSGILNSGMMKPTEALIFGLVSFFLAVPIGLYFLKIIGLQILPIFILGAIFVLLYTPVLTKLGYGIPEVSAGLGLGALPVFGVYVVVTGSYTYTALIYAMPSFFLVSALLLINEIPDVESDKIGGRRTLPIQIGKTISFQIYIGLLTLSYLWIIVFVALGELPIFSLLAFITLPIYLKILKGSKLIDTTEFTKIQGANVMFVLFTQILLGIGILINYLAGLK